MLFTQLLVVEASPPAKCRRVGHAIAESGIDQGLRRVVVGFPQIAAQVLDQVADQPRLTPSTRDPDPVQLLNQGNARP